jgi:hypothetical protein
VRHDRKPRATLYGPVDWEMNGLPSRAMYIQGVRPGDVVQFGDLLLANLGWCVYKACHDYSACCRYHGAASSPPSAARLRLPSTRSQCRCSFPEYFTHSSEGKKQAGP